MTSQPAPKAPQKQVAPIHFDDFSGEQFERLAFAFVLRDPKLHSVAWHGQSGSDGGKDILAKDANGDDHLFLESDVEKIAAARPPKLRYVTIIAGGKVSAQLKEKAQAEILAKLHINDSEVWGGREFEERLRIRAQDLVSRFVHGEEFPEQPEALRALATSSVEQAMEVDVEKLVAVDPRWDVKLNVVNKTKHYTLLPKEDISASLKVSGQNVAKMKEHFDYGKPVNLDGDALEMEGSPLFAHLIKEKGGIQSLAITPSKPNKVEFHFWSDGPDGFRLTLPGEITRGTVGLSFISQLTGAPLRAEMKIVKSEVTAPTGEGVFSFTFALNDWANKSISALPYFDRLRGFAHAIVHKKLVHQEITLDGNRVTGGTLGTPNDPEPFQFAAAVIENLAKAQAIVAKLGVTVVLPDVNNLAPEDYEAVDLAHAILFESSAPRKGFGFNGAITLNRKNHSPAEAIATLEALCTKDGMTLTQKNQEVLIYGTPVSLGDVTYFINPLKLIVPEPGRSQFLAGRSEKAPATLESLPESEVTITTASSSAGTSSDEQSPGNSAERDGRDTDGLGHM
jgi:hypothetical protein